MLLAGPLYPHTVQCQRALRNLLRARPDAQYLGAIPRTRLADFFANIDLLLFPSASSHETFGRMQFEARRAGAPVLAADFGPLSDLLPAGNLLPVNLRAINRKSLFSPFSFGWIDEAQLLQALSRKLE